MIVPPECFTNSPLGEEVQFNHEECGDTRQRLYVKRTRSGWLCHCHNCGRSTFKRSGRRRPSENVELLRTIQNITNEVKTVVPRVVCLPRDIQSIIPSKGLAWLYSYGISDEEIKRYNFCFSPNWNRLILPVYKDEELVYFQARTLGTPSKQNPKYLNMRGDKTHMFEVNVPGQTSVVIVEDILSAIKVGRCTNSKALLGSYIGTALTVLAKHYNKIFIWLDDDKRMESIKYARHLSSLTGVAVRVVNTPKDPKCYNQDQIRRILCKEKQ